MTFAGRRCCRLPGREEEQRERRLREDRGKERKDVLLQKEREERVVGKSQQSGEIFRGECAKRNEARGDCALT